jgi:hypothetical protein
MNALLLMLAILPMDLTSRAPVAANLGLTLSAPAKFEGGALTPVKVTLRNLGARPVRVVVEDCHESPFAVHVDGKRTPGTLGGCDDRYVRVIELGPGAFTSEEIAVALKPGRHKLEARYQATEYARVPGAEGAFQGEVRAETVKVLCTGDAAMLTD